LEIDCGHFDDPRRLVPRIQTEMRAAIARPYLKRNELASWDPIGDDVGGYLEEDIGTADYGPPRVLVDGQPLSWEDFGLVLRPYVGWSFQLHLGGALSPRAEASAVETIEVRPPTRAEQRAAARALRRPRARSSWEACLKGASLQFASRPAGPPKRPAADLLTDILFH
jgi:hypothetical protein